MRISEVKQVVADLLFAKELDKAYEDGIREGSKYTMSKLTMKLHAKKIVLTMTKTQEIGYDKAIAALTEGKHEVRGKTGAWA